MLANSPVSTIDGYKLYPDAWVFYLIICFCIPVAIWVSINSSVLLFVQEFNVLLTLCETMHFSQHTFRWYRDY